MAAQKFSKINLLPKDAFEFSTLGRVLRWALTSGRVLVVLTEFVVILAFGSRFYYDRKLNDLMETIDQKQAVVESYADIEKQMRDLLAREKIIDNYLKNNLRVSERIRQIKSVTPAGVSYEQITVMPTNLDLSGRAGSETAFYQVLTGLTALPDVTEVSVGGINFEQKFGQVNFKINAVIGKPKT